VTREWNVTLNEYITLETASSDLAAALNAVRDRILSNNGVDRGLSLHELEDCFAAGTPMSYADGGVRPIEQVRVGDWVLAPDQKDATGPLL